MSDWNMHMKIPVLAAILLTFMYQVVSFTKIKVLILLRGLENHIMLLI